MNKKQLIVVWVMVGCFLYIFLSVYAHEGIKPIQQQPLDSQLLMLIHNNILLSLFIVFVLGGLFIYALRSTNK